MGCLMSHETPNPPHNDSPGSDLGTLLRGEVSAPGPDYFDQIDASLARISEDRADGVHEVDFSTRSLTDRELTHTGPDKAPRPQRGFLLVAAAALVAILGMVFSVATLLTGNDDPSVQVVDSPDGANARDGDGETAGDGSGPVANLDHWHAVYGVWSCTAGDAADADESAGAWLPHFDSNLDPLGIHSHNDGLVHIHPFFDESAGANAQLHVFLDAMGARLENDLLTLPDGQVLRNGDDCGGEPAVLHLRKWQFDFLYDNTEPELITTALGATRFINDREVWEIVHAPLDAELPPIPSARFATMNSAAGSLTSIDATGLDETSSAVFAGPGDLAPDVEITPSGALGPDSELLEEILGASPEGAAFSIPSSDSTVSEEIETLLPTGSSDAYEFRKNPYPQGRPGYFLEVVYTFEQAPACAMFAVDRDTGDAQLVVTAPDEQFGAWACWGIASTSYAEAGDALIAVVAYDIRAPGGDIFPLAYVLQFDSDTGHFLPDADATTWIRDGMAAGDGQISKALIDGAADHVASRG